VTLEIHLPLGTAFVSVGEAPALIAKGLYPSVWEEAKLRSLQKRCRGEAEPVGLSERDKALLNEIWRHLPSLQEEIEKRWWPEYLFAFLHSPRKPAWRLVPEWRDVVLDTVILRTDAVGKHKKAIRAALRDGKLASVNHASLPLSRRRALSPTALIRVKDFEAYVAEFGLSLTVGVSPISGRTPTLVRREKKSEEYDRVVIAAIRTLGLDPKKLPKTPAGRPGNRARVRRQVTGQMPEAAFKKTWQRLRETQQIQESRR
jgi:hypothetical protein